MMKVSSPSPLYVQFPGTETNTQISRININLESSESARSSHLFRGALLHSPTNRRTKHAHKTRGQMAGYLLNGSRWVELRVRVLSTPNESEKQFHFYHVLFSIRGGCGGRLSSSSVCGCTY